MFLFNAAGFLNSGTTANKNYCSDGDFYFFSKLYVYKNVDLELNYSRISDLVDHLIISDQKVVADIFVNIFWLEEEEDENLKLRFLNDGLLLFTHDFGADIYEVF